MEEAILFSSWRHSSPPLPSCSSLSRIKFGTGITWNNVRESAGELHSREPNFERSAIADSNWAVPSARPKMAKSRDNMKCACDPHVSSCQPACRRFVYLLTAVTSAAEKVPAGPASPFGPASSNQAEPPSVTMSALYRQLGCPKQMCHRPQWSSSRGRK